MSADFIYYLEEYLYSGQILLNLLLNSFSSLLGIAVYVLSSLGFYTIAKRRGISRPWVAWIPVVRFWLVGCISDQYRYVVKGQDKSKRKSLLILSIINALLSVATIVMLVVLVVNCVQVLMYDFTGDAAIRAMLVPGIVCLALSAVLFGVAIAFSVIYYMAMYDVYTSCNPEYNTLFLLLGIFFRVTEAFFVFFNKDKDKGMPPIRVEQIQG